MKNLIVILMLLSSFVISAQGVSGTYQINRESTNGGLLRTLTLNTDGTFEFYSYEKHDNGIPKEKHSYGKGTWTQEKKVIVFSTETLDLDEKFTLNLNGSKARFITKSPRDTSNRVIKTSIQFYDTEVRILKGLKLIKF